MRVEHIDALYGQVVDLAARTRSEHDFVTLRAEYAHQVRTQKSRCAANPEFFLGRCGMFDTSHD
jgi:hypothetical protein